MSVGEQVKSLKGLSEELSSLLQNSFSAAPSAVFQEFVGGDEKNARLMELKTKALDLASKCADALSDVRLAVNLLIPKVEDGGNFGVTIQMALLKKLEEYQKESVKIFEDVATFHEKRLALIEKFSSVVSMEEKTSKVVEAVEKDKVGSSKTESKTTTSKEKTADQIQALAALDLKHWLQLKENLKFQKFAIATVGDFLAKNKDKVEKPRGSTSSYAY